ncbi:probable chitinase 2 isoform X2 [Vanessa cardui]|uniref:probable chitinase 2 isoform X2 n=1 Tax=Vanessa cardui TaxID=171605 RepID=UPI001F13760E|nr:probable chitinase 2 isoform X2 [Vanessa cardui]
MICRTSLFLTVTVFLTVGATNIEGPKHGKVAACYVASWAIFRSPPFSFSVSDIDPTLCTHIVYAFAGLDEESYTIKSLDPWLDIDRNNGNGAYKNLTRIKKAYPHVKITLSLGGWNEGSVKFSRMASDKWKRATFIRSVMQHLEKYGFDGLNVMWKYPTLRGGSPEDKKNFVTLTKELKEAFIPYGYILTATLANIKEIISAAYDLESLNRNLDLIYLIGYDYNGPWNKIVGASAPLRGLSKDERNVEYTIKYMLSHGVSPEKLVLGLQFHGKTFILKDPNVEIVEFGKTLAVTDVFAGPYLNGANMYGYTEVCLELKNNSKWAYHWDRDSSTPYLRDGRRIVSYDDSRSIANKVQLAMDYNLAGVMVWSIDLDDFGGFCDIPNDTYTDFVERFNERTQDKLWQDSFKSLNTQDLDGKIYGTSKGKPTLKLPRNNYKNYPLMRTIHNAIDVALEEKKIVDAIKLVSTSMEDRSRGDFSDKQTLCYKTYYEVCLTEPEY